MHFSFLSKVRKVIYAHCLFYWKNFLVPLDKHMFLLYDGIADENLGEKCEHMCDFAFFISVWNVWIRLWGGALKAEIIVGVVA